MKNTQKLTEGAILLAAFAVLLILTIFTPLVGSLLILVLPIPFIIFASKNDWKGVLIFVIAAFIISALTGALLTLPLIVPFMITGAIMGYLIQKNMSRTMILIICSLIFLIILVALYAVTVAFFHFNFIAELLKAMRESLPQSADLMKKLGQQKEAQQTLDKMKQVINLIEVLIPSVFVLLSLTYVFIIQLVSLPVLKRFGVNVGNWKPFREISLPKSILFYYFIVMLAGMVLHPQTGSYLNTALTNLSYILQILMVFQGITFVFFYLHQRNAAKPLPVIAVIFMFAFPFLLYIVGILGIIDLGFGLRKRTENK